MSGVETAGIVLGAMPLIIEAVKAYANGVSTVERYLKYEVPLTNLYTVLQAEYVIYQNTCEELLNGIVTRNDERAALLECPGGPGWKELDLERRMEQLLSKAYASYINTMLLMNGAVSDIKKLLKLGSDGKVQLNASTKFRKEYHRLKFSLRKTEYDDIVLQIRQHNATLRTLTHQSLKLEKTRKQLGLPDFGLIRQYATLVYNSLCAGLKCSCQTAHGVNLQLDRIENYCPSASPPAFRIVLSYSSSLPLDPRTPWILETVDIRPLSQTVSPQTQTRIPENFPHKKMKASIETVQTRNTAQDLACSGTAPLQTPVQIRNLCQTVCQIKHAYTGSCVGFLEDELTRQRLGLYQPERRRTAQHTPESLISLHKILSTKEIGRQYLPAGHRIRLAVLLASNLIQLYRTPWLTESWNHDDISFLQGVDGKVLKDAFISKSSIQSGAAGRSDSVVSQWDDFVLNRPLFALGILLIELCLGQPFEELRRRGGKGKSAISVASDFAVANQLLQDVTNEFGDLYSDAVRRCIRCAFNTNKTDLEDEQLQCAIYEGVIAPLEELMKNFKGLVV